MTTTPGDNVGLEFRRGSPEAVQAVRTRVGKILRFRGYGMTAEDRQDLEQEVMTQIWTAANRSGFDPGDRFWGFVEVVTARRAIDWLRKRRPETALAGDVLEPKANPQDSALERERRRRAAEALASLDEPCRRLLQLRIAEGLSYRAVAQTLGRSEGALRVQYLRCIEKARRFLAESADEPPRRERERL